MPETTVTVSLLRRYNLGNYEHIEASVEATVTTHEKEDLKAAVVGLQTRVGPTLALDHLLAVTGLGRTAAPASGEVKSSAPSAREVAYEGPVETAADPLSTEDSATPAGKAAEAAPADLLAEQPKRRGPGRPRKEEGEAAKAAKAAPAAEAGDPLTAAGEAAPPADKGVEAAVQAGKGTDAAAVRRRIIGWAGKALENSAVLTRTVAACGYAKLLEVPDAELADLAAVLGIEE